MEADQFDSEPKVDFTRRGCDSFASPRRSVKVELGFALEPRPIEPFDEVRSYEGDTTRPCSFEI